MKRHQLRALALSLLLALLGGAPAAAQCIQHEASSVPGTGPIPSGSRVAVSVSSLIQVQSFDGDDWTLDSVVAFGKPLAFDDDRILTAAGQIYRESDLGLWLLEADLNLLDPDLVGAELSGDLQGGRAVLGVKDANSLAGAIFIFEHGTEWQLVARRELANSPGARLGVSVALDGDLIVAGADWYRPQGVPVGAAAVYQRDSSGWQEAALLTHSQGTFLEFGSTVDVEDGTIAVGMPASPVLPWGPGVVFLYQETGGAWNEVDQVRAPSPLTNDAFGQDVTLDGERLFVHAAGASPQTYVYEFDGSWTWTHSLESRSGHSGGVRVDGSEAFIDGFYFKLRDLSLQIDRPAIQAGQSGTLSACRGAPGAPLMMEVTYPQGGNSILLPFGSFDAAGQVQQVLQRTNQPLPVRRVELRLLSLDARGRLVFSNTVGLWLP